jgi:hypothetical protein
VRHFAWRGGALSPTLEGTAMKTARWSLASSQKRLLVLPVIAISACVTWVMLPGPSDAGRQLPPRSPALKAHDVSLVDPATAPTDPTSASPGQATAPAVPTPPESASVDKPAIDGLKISSQSWRRGGLGSKALVTFTLRNANDFAVKDIEIACAFARRDGSHLTDRRRVIAETVNMKSRKTYSGMLIGFVNVNANKAKCSLVTASRT